MVKMVILRTGIVMMKAKILMLVVRRAPDAIIPDEGGGIEVGSLVFEQYAMGTRRSAKMVRGLCLRARSLCRRLL